MNYPRLLRVRQYFNQPHIEDVSLAATAALATLDLGQRIHAGQSVALTAGSRGIANISLLLKATADFLKRLGARPFIVPTMGSHGGATAEGQQHLLESYGITEQAIGVPIRSSMEVIGLGTTPEGIPVVLDRHAAEADHIGVVARVKPHTGYHGPIESGLLKMLMIGLGKHVGALEYHRHLLEKPYDQVVRAVGRTLFRKAPIAFGLAVVENAHDKTALVEVVAPEDFESREESLLLKARELLGRLPLRQADLLIVDEIGKNISGSGMDTNVVGRKRAFRQMAEPPGFPSMRVIFARGLSAMTHGNASGIGLADFTVKRLLDSMDYRSTIINCLTAGYPEGAMLPIAFDTDREVIDAALKIIGTRQPEEARVLRIRNTLELDELEISEACLGEPRLTRFEPIGPLRDMTFDAAGNLPAW